MSSARMITLFGDQTELVQRPTSLIFSALFHGLAFSLFSFGVFYTPRIDVHAATQRYSVRTLDLEMSEHPRAKQPMRYPGPAAKLQTATLKQGSGKHHPPALKLVAKAARGSQTILQPDLSAHAHIHRPIPVPSAVVWTPQIAPTNKIIAPLPDKATAANVTPSPDAPNNEVDLANTSLARLNTPSRLELAAGTTSPVTVENRSKVQMAPITVAQNSAMPTPTALLSVSNLRIDKGTVVLPPVNESVAQASMGQLGQPDPDLGGQSAGKNSGSAAELQNAESNRNKPTANSTASNGEQNPLADPLTDPHVLKQAHPITLAKDGEFGAVIVGSTLEEQFPEVAGVWNNRIAYTVYLHVGLSRSWILQYALGEDSNAPESGVVERIQAPWPYNILRPNIAPGSIQADALLVHGYVNTAGRFEDIRVAFPTEYADAEFVLKSLSQWQFRPATQQDKPIRVEILLIIPDALD